MALFVAGLVAGGVPSPAWADGPGNDWHVGLNMRTDFGTRFFRTDLGYRRGPLDFILVLDPLGVQHDDYDIDAIVRYTVAQTRWSVSAGGRVTTVPIGRAHQYHEKLLFGVSGLLPGMGTERLRVHSGLELAVHLLRHGAELDTRWVCIDSPSCRKSHFVFSLFARIEYVSPL